MNDNAQNNNTIKATANHFDYSIIMLALETLLEQVIDAEDNERQKIIELELDKVNQFICQ